MDNSQTQWSIPFFYFGFSFSLEHEEFFFFIGCIFGRMRVIDVARSFPHEEEIEGTIDRESEYEPCGEYAKYRDRDICQK